MFRSSENKEFTFVNDCFQNKKKEEIGHYGQTLIKEKTLYEYYNNFRYFQAKDSIAAWIYETKFSVWYNANELKLKYRNASIISSKRVVFNIKGNDFRLIVDIEYRLKIVCIVWFGTHGEYDKINVKTINYEN